MNNLFQLEFEHYEIKKTKTLWAESSGKDVGRGWGYPHGYDPWQVCDTFLVNYFLISVILTYVVYEMLQTPWRYTLSVREA